MVVTCEVRIEKLPTSWLGQASKFMALLPEMHGGLKVKVDATKDTQVPDLAEGSKVVKHPREGPLWVLVGIEDHANDVAARRLHQGEKPLECDECAVGHKQVKNGEQHRCCHRDKEHDAHYMSLYIR